MNREEMVEVFYGSEDYYLGLEYLIDKHPDNPRLRSCYEGTNIRDLVQCIIFERSKKVFKLAGYLKRPQRFILTSVSGEIIGVMVTMSLPEFYEKVGYEDYAVIGAETMHDYRKFLGHPSFTRNIELVAFNSRQAQTVVAQLPVKETHYWSIFTYRNRVSTTGRINIRLMNAGDLNMAKRLSEKMSGSAPCRSLQLQLKGLSYKNYALSMGELGPVFIGICPCSTGVYEIDYSVAPSVDCAFLPVAIEAVGRGR